MDKKKSYLYSLIIGIACGMVGVFILFLIYANAILKSMNTVPGASFALLAIIIRICISLTMASFLLRKWFLQENQYLSDIPFLFGTFFLLHAFGKFVDIVNFFTFNNISDGELLMITKIRQFVAIATLAPMMYLSLTMIIFFVSLNREDAKYANQRERDKISLRFLCLIIIIEAFAIILTPNLDIAVILFPVLVIPSLIVIVWIMFFSYKHQRLSQIHPLIIGIGFLIYLFASGFRPVALLLLGNNTLYIIFAEFLEIIVFSIIFVGLLLKANYEIS